MSVWLYFLNLIFIIHIALCEKRVLCDFSDEACLTAAHRLVMHRVVTGNSTHNIKSSDPLHRDKIQAFLPSMNITLTEPNMYGTKACSTRRMKIDPDIWLYVTFCPKLTLESDYEINGDVDSVHIEGKGRCEIIYENYLIGINGGYETHVGANGKDYLNITDYKIDLMDVQGRIIYNFTNLFHGDNEKSMKVHEYINGNWKKLHDIIGELITYSLFGFYIENVNKYLAILPKFEIFYKPATI